MNQVELTDNDGDNCPFKSSRPMSDNSEIQSHSSQSPITAPTADTSDTTSTKTLSLEASEEDERSDALGWDEVDAFEHVDVVDLCSRPIGEQERIVTSIKQKEKDRYNADRQTAIGIPEEFSKTHVGNYLKEAKFQLRLKRCRLTMGSIPSSSDGHKVRRIATDAERCYIFEREVEERHQQLSTETKKEDNRILNRSLGQMLPGESIVDASLRLQKSKQSLSTSHVKQNNDEQKQDIEWETISLPSYPKGSKTG